METPQRRMKLRQARERCGLSKSEVAAQLRTTPEIVGMWEGGTAHPSPYFRRKLIRLLQTDDLDLFPHEPLVVSANASYTPPPRSRTHQPIHPALYDSAIPHVARLIGRQQDLDAMKRSLLSTSLPVVLHGLPGVGKTTLAAALAHDQEIRTHFCDGILWAGLGPHPNSMGLLSHWGTLLTIPTAEMQSLKDSAAWTLAIHNAIGARSILLVIDDVWSIEDALAFKVGGPNCAHLITTRYPEIASFFSAEGTSKIQTLGDEESMALLHLLAPEVVDRETQRARDLVHMVGGLPLALTLMGNYLRQQMRSGQAHHIAAALEHLSSAEERLHIQEASGFIEPHPNLSLASVIAVTDQQLSEPMRAALYALSVFPPRPNSFSEEAALAVAACGTDILDALIDVGMLESSGANRYMLHQTISDYAQFQLQRRPDHETAYHRLVSYVNTFLEHNSNDYEPLEQESVVITVALEYAHQFNMHVELVRAVSIFTLYLQWRSLYALAEQHLLHAEQAAIILEDQHSLSLIYLYTGQVLQQQGRFMPSEALFQKGLALARQLNDLDQISTFLNDLGWVTWKLGKYTQAEAYLQEGLKIACHLQNQKRVASILKGLGVVAGVCGKYIEAETYLQESLALVGALDQQEQLTIDVLLDLGYLLGKQGMHQQAADYFRKALEIARSLNLHQRICALLTNLGAAEMEMGRYAQAENAFLEGLEVASHFLLREWQAILLLNLGEVASARNNFRRAKRFLTMALEIARSVGRKQIIAKVLYELGNVSIWQCHINAAQASFDEMISLVPEGDQELHALASYGLARVAAAQGDMLKAFALGKQAMTVLETIGHGNTFVVRSWLEQLEQGE